MFDPTDGHTNHDGASVRTAYPADRMPPQNIEAERGVLGAVLMHNAAMHDVAEILKPEDFFRDAHIELYRAILDLYDRGKPFDVVILADAMGPRYRAIGGDGLIVEIMDSVPHAANARYHAQIVRQKSVGRALVNSATDTLRECYSDEFTAEQLLESAERRVFAISESEATGETVGAVAVLESAWGSIEARERNEFSGISSGFDDLDDLTDGLQDGNLIIAAARPSQGKTALGLNVATFASTEGRAPTLFVSLEMNRTELGLRLLSAEARVDGYKLRNPRALNPQDREKLGQVQGVLRNARLFIDDTPIRTVTQIAANARRIKSRHGLGLIVVDYIQLIDGQRHKGESRQEEVARISKRLKALARELKVPVIALAQLNRESERRDDRRPRLADLRESGQIEADADVVILIHRPSAYDANDRPGEADLIVAKNRNGATGTVRMVFHNSYTRFDPMAPQIDPGLVDAEEF